MLTILWNIIRFLFLTVPVPMAAGTLLSGRLETALGAQTRASKLIFRWISGQFLLWAGFQLICVPMILREKTFGTVVLLFSAYTAVLVLTGAGWGIYAHRHPALHVVAAQEEKTQERSASMLWLLFAALLLIQLVCACALAYADGDDAFYVAVSTLTENADTMYFKNPYSSGYMQLDIRHGLAPMPIWVAYLSRLSGIRTVVVAHVAEPLILIVMFYGIVYLLGEKLFGAEGAKLPLFLALTGLLVLFGGYSLYSAESFLLARTIQGKAILGNLVLPMLILLLLVLLERLSQGARCPFGLWILLWAVMLTGCLCSTQGTVLVCLLTAVAGLCSAAAFRKWKFLFPLASSCIFPCIYALLYLRA